MTQAFETLGFIRKRALCELWGIGETKVDQDEAAGLLPKRIMLSPRVSGWLPSEIAAVRQAIAAGKSLEERRALVKQLEAQRKQAA